MPVAKEKQLTTKEKEALLKKMRGKQGDATKTADMIGISRSYLYDAINGERMGDLTLMAIRTFLQSQKQVA